MSDMRPTWLMIKQHATTGLKYLCKTTKSDPYKYKGSGIRWTHHLKKYGREVNTLWCEIFTDRELLVETALRMSKENNIVESSEWANLVVEDGITGWPPGTKHTAASKEKCRLNANGFKKGYIPHNKGKKLSEHHYSNQIKGMMKFREENPEKYEKTLQNLKITPDREQKRIAAVKKRMSGANNWNYDSSLYTFKNIYTGETKL